MNPGRMLACVAAVSLGRPLGHLSPLTAQCPDGSPPPCRSATRPAAPAPNSVAVLYFDNLSRDTADAYLAEGLTDEIIARLGQIERLNVKSRTAVSRHRGAGTDPMVLSRSLGVAYVVNGTVRRGKDRLRVTVELLQAASGDRLWGQQYDRAQADFLAIQEDIAVSVASAIAGRLLPAERSSLAGRPTRRPAAYDHFVKGNYYLGQRTPRAVARAIEEYQAAGEAVKRAIALDPRNAEAHHQYAFVLLGLGEDSAAAEDFRRALDLDPERPITLHHLGVLRIIQRRYDEALRWLDSALSVEPAFADAYPFRALSHLLL